MLQVFTAVFFAVVFLGRSADCEIVKITSCDRANLYCYREDFFALCIDAEELHVYWKLNFQCFLGINCKQDDFPCGLPPSPGVLAIAQAYDLSHVTTEGTNGTDATSITDTTEIANVTITTTETTETTESTEIANVTITTTETTETTESTETETTTISTTTPGTTTTVGPPTCTSPGTYKGPSCQQYYQCISVWWWYEPTLVTCGSGQSYNTTANSCTADLTCQAAA